MTAFSAVIPQLLRIQPIHHPRERNAFSDVLPPRNPRNRPFKSQPKSRVHERSVLAQLEIPAIRLNWQSMLADRREQFVVVILALAATDDFTVAFRRKQVIA